MAGESALPRMASVRETVRIEVEESATEEERTRFTMDYVFRQIIMEVCGYTGAQIYCLQDFTKSGSADVTLMSPAACREFYDRCVKRGGHQAMKGLRCRPLFAGEKVPIIVHMYNPHVAEEEIGTFLRRYCSEVTAGERLNNVYGIWTGKRRYVVRFRTNAEGQGGVLYPPGKFSIGPHRGFLWFPGQPMQCWRCGGLGHNKEECTGRRCRNCGKEGHQEAECRQEKACNLCGSTGHLYRQCPSRKPTYADKVKGAEVVQDGRKEETEQETRKGNDEDESEWRVVRSKKRKKESSSKEEHMAATAAAIFERDSTGEEEGEESAVLEEEESDSAPSGAEDRSSESEEEVVEAAVKDWSACMEMLAGVRMNWGGGGCFGGGGREEGVGGEGGREKQVDGSERGGGKAARKEGVREEGRGGEKGKFKREKEEKDRKEREAYLRWRETIGTKM